jgi:alpha,alpha-trehalose phosphorylase
MAAEVGHLDLAFDYLGEAALMDLDDLEHNTRDGVHIASLAGTYIALIAGFAGLRLEAGAVGFSPRLPDGITRLAFTATILGRRLRADFSHTQARYLLASGDGLEISHHGTPVMLAPGEPVVQPMPAVTPRDRPRQPRGREPARRRTVQSQSPTSER